MTEGAELAIAATVIAIGKNNEERVYRRQPIHPLST